LPRLLDLYENSQGTAGYVVVQEIKVVDALGPSAGCGAMAVEVLEHKLKGDHGLIVEAFEGGDSVAHCVTPNETNPV
jgi:hypothetical protein